MPDGPTSRIDPAAAVRATARDLGFLVVGFGILTFQRAQVKRRELERRFGCDLGQMLRGASGRG